MSLGLSPVTTPGNSLAERRRAIVLIAGFAFAWVLVEEVVGARLQGHYPLMQVVWCRYAAHLVVLLALTGWSHPWRTGRPVYQLARSMMMLVMPLSFALAVQGGTPPGAVWAVFWIAPLLILAFASWMLGERASWQLWLAATAGALAAAGMLAPSQPIAPQQLLLPAAMALSFAIYVVMTRSLRSEPLQANLFYTALGVFLALTPFMPGAWVMPSGRDALVLFAIGLVGLVALLALDRSAAVAPVSGAAPALYLHLPCLAAVALVMEGQRPPLRTVAAGLLIAVIVWYLYSSRSTTATPQRDSIKERLQ